MLAGCGGLDSESSDTSETTATVEATQTTTETTRTIGEQPPACVPRGGWAVQRGGARRRLLARLPRRAPYAITIHKLATPAKAPTVVAGTYAVTGSFKVAAEGEGLSSIEGLLADALVQDVAACLGD